MITINISTVKKELRKIIKEEYLKDFKSECFEYDWHEVLTNYECNPEVFELTVEYGRPNCDKSDAYAQWAGLWEVDNYFSVKLVNITENGISLLKVEDDVDTMIKIDYNEFIDANELNEGDDYIARCIYSYMSELIEESNPFKN